MSSARRVLHVITGLGTGGAETNLLRLVEQTQGDAIEHTVVSMLSPGTLAEPLRRAGATVHSLQMQRGLPNPSAVLQLVAHLRTVAPDVVQGWMYHANLLASAAARFTGHRVLWGIRHALDAFAEEPLRLRLVIRASAFMSAHPAAVVYNSERSARQHEALGFDAGRSLLIPNGFDTGRFRPDPLAASLLRRRLQVADETPLVSLVARVDPLKDHRMFLEAAARVHTVRPDVHFVLAGRGTDTDSDISRMIEALGIGTVVHRLGEQSGIPAIFAGSTIATLTSRSEGFPNAIGEAMACGVPCAVTDVGDAALLVGDTGKVTPSGNPAAMASAWHALLEEPSPVRQARGAAARQRIESQYSLSSIVDRYRIHWQAPSRRADALLAQGVTA